jgi:hypothetical protein
MVFHLGSHQRGIGSVSLYLEFNNMINLLYKTLFMNLIFKLYFVSLSIFIFMNHFEFMTEIVKLHNIDILLKVTNQDN